MLAQVETITMSEGRDSVAVEAIKRKTRLNQNSVDTKGQGYREVNLRRKPRWIKSS